MFLVEQIDAGYRLETFFSFPRTFIILLQFSENFYQRLILGTFCLLMSEYCNVVTQLPYFYKTDGQLLLMRSVMFLGIPHSQQHHFRVFDRSDVIIWVVKPAEK